MNPNRAALRPLTVTAVAAAAHTRGPDVTPYRIPTTLPVADRVADRVVDRVVDTQLTGRHTRRIDGLYVWGAALAIGAAVVASGRVAAERGAPHLLGWTGASVATLAIGLAVFVATDGLVLDAAPRSRSSRAARLTARPCFARSNVHFHLYGAGRAARTRPVCAEFTPSEDAFPAQPRSGSLPPLASAIGVHLSPRAEVP